MNLQVHFGGRSPPRHSAIDPADPAPVPHNVLACRSEGTGPKRKVGQWTDAQMHVAIAAVERGAKIKAVARDFDIPQSTLGDHMNRRVLQRKKGPPTMLTHSEETSLEAYILKMQEYAYPLSMDQLQLKVAEMVQDRVMPFRDGIPGNGWIKWFKRRHSNLTLRHSKGLEFSRAKGLCPENVRSFYSNLEQLYSKENYLAERIWNSDETSAQAGRNGGGRVWAKKGSRFVHRVLPNEREWLTNLTCVNAAGDHIPGFYVFRGKRLRSNYVIHYEDGAAMAMQTKAWMTATLFSHWISHFIRCLESKGGISNERRHLLILDGHNSHVTLEVVQKCREVRLDLLTLPSHTSHRLQPLDVSVFAPFKHYFKRYRDAWSVNNKGKGASKQTLAMWVSKALERALTTRNITTGFRTTKIFPLNREAVDAHMGTAGQFRSSHGSVDEGGGSGEMGGSNADA